MDVNKFLENRAEVTETERIRCENCFEQVVFLLQDKNHEFSVGLSTILECLAFAIKNGDLPKLPASWCSDVENALGVYFDEGTFYSDPETFEKRNAIKFIDKNKK